MIKRMLPKLSPWIVAVAFISAPLSSLADTNSCQTLKTKLDKAFPNILVEQPSLKKLTETIGPYTQKTHIGTRYEWEKDGFMLIIQETHEHIGVSIVPEKIDQPGKPPIEMPPRFSTVLRTAPSEALTAAQDSLGTSDMKTIQLYEYAWNCSSNTANGDKPNMSEVRARFDSKNDFVALFY